MGLGYEGWIKVADTYALGTGASVPRARQRIESAAGYGGDKEGPSSTMGVGLPYNYDYDQFDGSLNYEVSKDFYETVILDWLFKRQTAKEVKFGTRGSGQQQFQNCFWTSLGLSASDGSNVEGSASFYAIERDSYVYGNEYPNDKQGTGDGSSSSPVCSDPDFPPSLNNDNDNLNPIPYWNTDIAIIGIADAEFINWSVDFNQDVVRFFACEANTSAQEPKYLAVGPMAATFSGSYMLHNDFLGDTLDQVEVIVGGVSLFLKRLEANTEADDVQSPDALVPLTIEYTAYEVAA